MNTPKKHGAAFDDSQRRTIRELEKKVEQFGKFYDDFDEFFNDLCEYYNGFPEFYEHTWKKAAREWVRIYEDAKAAKGLAGEEEKVLQFMEEEAAKRDAEVDAALAKAKASKEALKGLEEESIASREAEIINSRLNSKESFEAASLDDLPPMQDHFLTFGEWKAAGGGEAFDEWHELGAGIDEVNKILKETNAPLTICDWITLDKGLDIPNVWGKRTFADWNERGLNDDEALKLLEEQGALPDEDWERLRAALKVLAEHYKKIVARYKELTGKGTTTTTKEG